MTQPTHQAEVPADQPEAAVEPVVAAEPPAATSAEPAARSAVADSPAEPPPVNVRTATAPATAPAIQLATALATSPATAPATAPTATAPSGEPLKGEVVAASVLQVNDRHIAADEVLQRVKDRVKALPSGLSRDVFRSRAETVINNEIRDLVTSSLVHAEASKRLTEEMNKHIDEEVNKELTRLLAFYGGSRQRLEQAYRNEGRVLSDDLDDYKKRLQVQTYLRQRFYPAIVITRKMLWDYYRLHQDDYVSPKTVQMQLLSMPVSEFIGADGAGTVQLKVAREQARSHIEQAAAELKAGADFAKVVGKYSKGVRAGSEGVWPAMPRGSFREKAVEDAAWSLEEGQISEIIETDSGFYIVKALKVQPEQCVSFEEAQTAIEEHLRSQQYRKLTDDYLLELIGRSMILQSEQFTRLVVDRAVEQYWQP